jgi:hypothetical protein
MRGLDDKILREVRPAFYGRYIDDIILVTAAHDDPTLQRRPIENFLDHLLVQTGILNGPLEGRYEVQNCPHLQLQFKKVILQYFDADDSIAGLVKFQKKLEQNASEFVMLPVDEGDGTLEDVAFDLLYEGSVNKFRSVQGTAENRFELSKHLTKQTLLHLLTDDAPDRHIIAGIRKFFRGTRAVEFFELWEAVLTFFEIARDRTAGEGFAESVLLEIKRVRFPKNSEVTKSIQRALKLQLMLSMAMSRTLTDVPGGSLPRQKVDLLKTVAPLRAANLMRHHFVRTPLLNFTTFDGPLSARRPCGPILEDPAKVRTTPRFVNFDECMLAVDSGLFSAGGEVPFDRARRLYRDLNGHDVSGIEWETNISAADEEVT